MNDLTTSRLSVTAATLLIMLCALQHACGGDWPAWRGNAALTGQTATRIADHPQLIWRTHIGSAISASPVAAGGKIFVVTESGSLAATDTDGTILWQRTFTNAAGQNLSFPSSPVCVADTVIACSETGTLYSLAPETGNTIWTTNTGAIVLSSPAYASSTNGTHLYVIDQPSGALHCVRASDGETTWQTGGKSRTDGPLSLSAGQLVFGSCDSAVHTVSTGDGQHLGSIKLGEGCEIAGGIAVSDGYAFTGNRGGSVVCVNLNTHRVVWTNSDATGELFTTPSVESDRIVVSDGRGDISCLDRADGQRLWTVDSGAMDPRSPVIAGEHVVVAMDGSLVVFRLDTGKRIWRQDVSDEITSPAIVTGGLIIVGTDEGDLVAFGTNRGRKPQ